MNYLNPIALEEFLYNMFHHAGLNEEEARVTAHHLVKANLRNVETHGLQRAPIYVEKIRKGGMSTNIEIEIDRETPVSAVINGKGGVGQYVGQQALKIAIDKAKSTGVGVVGVYNSNHTGMLAYYSEIAVKEDLIAFVTSNAEALMAPTGGKERYLSVNPITFAFPAGVESPFILDFSSGVAARGKIILALKNNEKIPVGWAIDKNGNPTTDPEVALEGFLQPVGGHKGYGLAFMADIFSGILTGANWGPHINSLYKKPEMAQGNGQFFFIMRADLFMELDEFKARMDQAIREIKAVKKAEGVDQIYIPGEIEENQLKERMVTGVPVQPHLIKELNEAALSVGYNEDLFDTKYQQASNVK